MGSVDGAGGYRCWPHGGRSVRGIMIVTIVMGAEIMLVVGCEQ